MISMKHKISQFIHISLSEQKMACYEHDHLIGAYHVSTGKNGCGERVDSEQTPRGWHRVHSVIGNDAPINSVFVARVWTQEIYTEALAVENPNRDWILTRVIRLEGIEPLRNKGGDVDTLNRHIYIHGTPDTTKLGVPGSRGCVRMRNSDLVKFASWVSDNTLVYIE